MGPIQALGNGWGGWLNRPSSINDAAQTPGANQAGSLNNIPLMAQQSISAMNVGSSVSQLLSSIGGGIQNDKMLEMMIALIIIMSLLEQQRGGGGGGGGDALSKLSGLGSGMSSSSISYSSTVISTQSTTLSYTQLHVNQISGTQQAGGANQPRIDMTA